ncbi:MAG: BACON domain-containing protein [Bacteroidales bacterium]|nr:BACON domain-containing protein [Bacteroidales bacterium]
MKKLLLSICAAAALLFTSCSDPVAPEISFSEWYFTIPYTGGEVYFNLTANMPWDLKIDENDPLEYHPKSGEAGTYLITASLPATDLFTSTSHNLRGTARSEVTTNAFDVKITQEPRPGLVISPVKVNVPKGGKLVEVTLSTNESWTCTSEPAGLDIYPASGTTGDYKILINIPENTGSSSLMMDISFSISSMTEHLLIIQD